MKTSLNTRQNFFNFFIYNKPINHLCTRSLLFLRFFWPEVTPAMKADRTNNKEKTTSENSKSRKSLSLNRLRTGVLAGPVAVALSNAKAISQSFPRFITGLVLIVGLAPFADVFYTYLDFDERVSPEVWYYESWHWFFLCLGPYFSHLFFITGIYLCLIPKSNLIITGIMSWAMMWTMSRVIWLAMVDNHDEYLQLPPVAYLAYGLAVSALVLFLLDKLTYWLNHRVRAIESRIDGLKAVAGVLPKEQIEKLAKEVSMQAEKVSQFNQY